MNNVVRIAPRSMMIPVKYLLYSIIDLKNTWMFKEKLKN